MKNMMKIKFSIIRYDNKQTKETIENIKTVDNMIYSKIDNNNRVSQCWNCSEKINNLIGYPIHYDKNVFYCYGDFCCFGFWIDIY